MTAFFDLTAEQAEQVLVEFLAEREPALEQLRELMNADGLDPDEVLDGTPDSLIPVWAWAKTRLGLGDPTALQDQPVPAWMRHQQFVEPALDPISVPVIDGIITYWSQLLQTRLHELRWQVGESPAVCERDAEYEMYHRRPVLVAGEFRREPPQTIASAGRRFVGGSEKAKRDDELCASFLLTTPESLDDWEPYKPDPPIRVEEYDDPDDEDFPDYFIIGLDDLIYSSTKLPKSILNDLREQSEIINATYGENPEEILVKTDTWTPAQVQAHTLTHLWTQHAKHMNKYYPEDNPNK